MVRSNLVSRRGRRLLRSDSGQGLHFKLSETLESESENAVELSSRPAAIGIGPDEFLVFHAPPITAAKDD